MPPAFRAWGHSDRWLWRENEGTTSARAGCKDIVALAAGLPVSGMLRSRVRVEGGVLRAEAAGVTRTIRPWLTPVFAGRRGQIPAAGERLTVAPWQPQRLGEVVGCAGGQAPRTAPDRAAATCCGRNDRDLGDTSFSWCLILQSAGTRCFLDPDRR